MTAYLQGQLWQLLQYILYTSGYSGVRLMTAYLQGQLWQLLHTVHKWLLRSAPYDSVIARAILVVFSPRPGHCGRCLAAFQVVTAALAVPLVPRAVLPLLRLWPQFKNAQFWQLFL
jgi:hypothetical protein